MNGPHNPPPNYPHAHPQPARTGRGWRLLSLALLAILGLMVGGRMLENMAGAGPESDAKDNLTESTLKNPEASAKLAVIPVEGMILGGSMGYEGGNMVASMEAQLKRAAEDAAVKGVLLKIDSPGGEVVASDDIARLIREFQEKTGKPVVASMGALAASGGYYISAPCRWIVANELTITGSIGVIMQTYNYRELMDKVGVRAQTFKSGKFKDMLSGSKKLEEIDPAEREMMQEMIMASFSRFKQVVKEGRAEAAAKNPDTARPLASNWEEFADGRVLHGKAAFEHGFVDELGHFETAVASAKRLAGISGQARLVTYKRGLSLGNLFRMLGGSEAGGRTLKIETGLKIPHVEPGRPYFLLPALFE